MPFVKLDTGILNSSLWCDREARDVFITALLLAMPKTYPEPIAQLSVRDLIPTGYEVPPGEYGFVDASGPGIVRAAIVEREAGMAALERLGEPDPDSRSEAFEGRRLLRFDGGYLVLNLLKYRDKDHTSPERQRRHRERIRNDINQGSLELRSNVTHPDAEAYPDAPEKTPAVDGQAYVFEAALIVGVEAGPFIVRSRDLALYQRAYPAVDCMAEFSKMTAWLHSNRDQRKTLGGMPRFVNTWLAKEQNGGRRAAAGAAPGPDLSVRAIRAWGEVRTALRNGGQPAQWGDPLTAAALKALGGYHVLRDCTSNDLTFRGKDFEKLFVAEARR